MERMEHLPQEMPQPKVVRSSVRAGMENMIREHFGEEILDEVFDTYGKKYEESICVFNSVKAISLFVLLKRKASSE